MICAIIMLTVNIIQTFLLTFCHTFTQTLPIFIGLYYTIGWLVLATLLLRLYYTFKESMFEITPYQKWFFIISYIIGVMQVILAISSSAGMTLLYWGFIFLLGILLGMINGVYAMRLFSQKMYQLIKLRATSRNNHDENGLKVQFNDHQKRLLKATQKYVTLLSIAMLSTWISWIYNILLFTVLFPYVTGNEIIFNILVLTFRVLLCIDCTVNIVCLYLQWEFGKKYYDKYCVCFGDCCMYVFTAWRLNGMGKERVQQVSTDTAINNSQVDTETNGDTEVVMEKEDVGENDDETTKGGDMTFSVYESVRL